MKRKFSSAIALLVGLGLAGAGIAQGRHNEKPHGVKKAKSVPMSTSESTDGTPAAEAAAAPEAKKAAQ